MFDNIIYINLSHRTDRKKHVLEQIQELHIQQPVIRMNAVNGNIIDLDAISSKLITANGKKDALNTSLSVGVPLTKGGIGCALSHRNVYLHIIKNKLQHTLILEDDVYFDPDFIKKVNDIPYPTDYDLFFLGYHSCKITTPNYVDKLICHASRVYGLFGYIVSYKGAQKLLNIFPLGKQIDTEISNNLNKFNAFFLTPRNRILFSDKSSIHTTFGTDIQIRESNKIEKFNANTSETQQTNTHFCIYKQIFILLCVLFLVCKCLFK
jgi:GR25 family glycosyltransferase involved in LPS biosynthesis